MSERIWDKKNEKMITHTIDRNLYAEFRKAIIDRYGREYGFMYQEWNQAIYERIQKLKQETKHKAPIIGPEEE